MRCFLIATRQQNRKKHSNFSSKQWLLLTKPHDDDWGRDPLPSFGRKAQNMRIQELENGPEPYRIREMYIDMTMQQTRSLTRVQAESLANSGIGIGPELDPHMIPLVVNELLVFYKKEAEKAFKQAHSIVYNAVVDRVQQPGSHDKILDKFILEGTYTAGVTVEAEWGDYLCSEAYAIVKDDVHP